METANIEPTLSYLVISRDEQTTLESRAEAVALAKQLTLDNDTSVTVERTDNRERMQFRQGSLIDFVYEIRTGRSNRDDDRSRGRNRDDEDDLSVLDDDEESDEDED